MQAWRLGGITGDEECDQLPEQAASHGHGRPGSHLQVRLLSAYSEHNIILAFRYPLMSCAASGADDMLMDMQPIAG